MSAFKIYDLSDLQVRGAQPQEVERCRAVLAAHHYLPDSAVVGNQGWQIAEIDGEWVAVSLWAAAAKRLKPREAWIGWDNRTRAERLKLVVQQARFCVLVEQPNLASCVLGALLRHLPAWWQRRQGYTPLLAETFVDPQRFQGTCYRAAGWQELGATHGSRRAGRDYYVPGDGLKTLWLKPLVAEAAARLRGPAGQLPPSCRPALPVAAMGVLPVSQGQAESLYAALSGVPDPRAHNRKHRVGTVLTLVALGLLMGHNQVMDFVRLATQLNQRQRELLGYWRPPRQRARRAPGKDVFYTLLRQIDPNALAAVLNRWVAAQHGLLPEALALDGKAIADRLAQVVSLVHSQTGATVALAPVLTAEKEHEVPAARALLAATDLNGALVSLDAGHANHATAQTIVASGGEYLLQLKGNTPAVHAAAVHAVPERTPLFRTTTPVTAGSSTAN
jgi:hypothetical protein